MIVVMRRTRVQLDDDTDEEDLPDVEDEWFDDASEESECDPILIVTPRTKCNEEITKRFCRLLREGLTLDAACDYLGIAPTTFHAWRRKGKLFLNGNGKPAKYEVYAAFELSTRRALALFRRVVTQRLMAPKNGNWARDMTILERRDRANYNKSDPQGGADEDFDPDERYL